MILMPFVNLWGRPWHRVDNWLTIIHIVVFMRNLYGNCFDSCIILHYCHVCIRPVVVWPAVSSLQCPSQPVGLKIQCPSRPASLKILYPSQLVGVKILCPSRPIVCGLQPRAG